jgi:hypothetical protein
MFHKSPKLSQKFVNDACDESKYSPDLWKLEMYHSQLLYVYDELMQGHRAHELLADHCVPLEENTTMGEDRPLPRSVFTAPSFHMIKRNLGQESYPIVMGEGTFNAPPGRIKGELYAVRTQRFRILDEYHDNLVKFVRVRVNLDISYQQLCRRSGELFFSERTKRVRAWMYIGIPKYWNPLIDGGYLFKPVRAYEPNNFRMGRYYYFSQQEYDV